MPQTISYSEKAKGWTHFPKFIPDWMARLNNRFFTIKNGQLWEHNDNDNPVRNNFYGEQFGSKIVTVINDDNSQDKIFKTLILESNRPWEATLKTNYTNSTIKASEFNKIESRFFAHTRQNENVNDLRGHAAQGIGTIVSFAGLNIIFAAMPNLVSVNDQLFQINGSAKELIGVIINIEGVIITVDAITTAPVTGYFCYAKKNSRVEGSEMRGNYLEITLENNDTQAVGILAVNTNAVKSFI